MTTTISGAVRNTNITISTAAYPSPVTITKHGFVGGSGGPSAAVNMVTTGASLQNSGAIYGQDSRGSSVGQVGLSASGGTIVNYGNIGGGYGYGQTNGGDGVDLGAGSTLTNVYGKVFYKNYFNNFSYLVPGYVYGGGVRGGGSGTGGIGVSIAAGATLTNTGHIKSNFSFGKGGTGVYLAAGGTLINVGPTNVEYGYGLIRGGNGYHGAGGAGVILAAGASFTNGTIKGGGYSSIQGGSNYTGSVGGAGVYLHSGASLTNAYTGAIEGGHWNGPVVASPNYTSVGGDGVDLATNAHGINEGFIRGGNERGADTGGIGVSLAAGATFTNTATGSIGGGGGYKNVANGSGGFNIADAGTGGAGAYVGSNAVLVNLGQGHYNAPGLSPAQARGITGGVALAGGAGVVLNGGTFVNAGLVVGGYNNLNGGYGTNRADAVEFGSKAGTLVVESGFDFLGNVVAVSGVADVLEVSGSSTIALSGIGTEFQNFDNIAFADGAAWTISGNSSGLAGGAAISGFTRDDKIDLTDFAATSKNYIAGTGLVLRDGSNSVTLDITGHFTTADFSIVTDGASGTLISDDAPCYCPGTLIETRHGEKEVEELEIGDEVVTAAGALRPIKWIGRRSYTGRFIIGRKDVLPVCIKAGALADNVPQRDLRISPHHAMYFADPSGGVLIEARDLVNGVSIVQADDVDRVEYLHIELETHDVIIAEGALSESFIDDDSRGMFYNAHEYATLYADEVALRKSYCAPRLDHGYEVEMVRAAVASRAGLLRAADPLRPGTLRGCIDHISAKRITGWAQNIDYPEAPVCLDIHAGGRLIGQILANAYRDDLKQAGLGSGHHSFTFTPPAGLGFAPDAVEVRRSCDGAVLECPLRRGETAAPPSITPGASAGRRGQKSIVASAYRITG